MSDTADSTEQVQSTSDADGCGQLANDGGDATIGYMKALGRTLGKYPEKSVDPVIRARHAVAVDENIGPRKKTTSNVIEGKVGWIGNEIDMTSRKEGGTRWYNDDVGVV